MKNFSFIRLLLLSLFAFWLWGAVDVAGPWRGQMVDAETGKPLEGVVILTSWSKLYRTPAGWAGGGYYTSQEVVTGPDGRFTIARQWIFTPTPGWSVIKGPEWLMFKPGYGRFQFRDMKGWEERDSYEFQARGDDIHRRFSRGEEFVIELPLLKTREERLNYYSYPDPHIPKDHRTRFDEAYAKERQSLGLGR